MGNSGWLHGQPRPPVFCRDADKYTSHQKLSLEFSKFEKSVQMLYCTNLYMGSVLKINQDLGILRSAVGN